MRHTRASKGRDSRGRALANRSVVSKRQGNSAVMLTEDRPQALRLKRLQLMADNSPQAANAARLQAMADSSPDPEVRRMLLEGPSGGPVQRQGAPEEEELQMKADPGLLQRQADEEEDLQMKAAPGLLQRQGEEEEELQMKAAPGLVQRQGMEEEEEL